MTSTSDSYLLFTKGLSNKPNTSQNKNLSETNNKRFNENTTQYKSALDYNILNEEFNNSIQSYVDDSIEIMENHWNNADDISIVDIFEDPI